MKGIYICQCCGQPQQFTYPDRQPNVPAPARITAPCQLCTRFGCAGIKTFLPVQQQPQGDDAPTFYFTATCDICGTTTEVESKTPEPPAAPACPNTEAHERLKFMRHLIQTDRIRLTPGGDDGPPEG